MNYNKQFLLLKAVVLIVFLFSITDSIYPQSPPSVIWSKIWGGQGLMDDNGYSCTSDGSGFLYVTGTTKSSTGNVDVITIKYSLSNGDTAPRVRISVDMLFTHGKFVLSNIFVCCMCCPVYRTEREGVHTQELIR